ncbi:MAG TPA: CbbQ/NirQ/NorQ/GpvN family protein [Candidatus Azoamicus sp. OHIO2]
MTIYYKEITNEIDIFKKAFINKLPLIIKGPTGCGKSRFVEKMSEIFNIPLIQIACNEETSSVDLQGRYLMHNGNTIWHDGPATTAVKTGAFLYLDEISEAREDVIVVIHPLSDHRRELYLDKKNEKIKAHNNFMLIASYNPGYQSKSKDLKQSTKQRFLTLQFDYPEEIKEQEIIIFESNIDSMLAGKLVLYAKKLRNLKELDLLETVSTRLLINAAKMIVSGLNVHSACKIAIIQTLTDDKDIQISLTDIMSLYI